MRRNALLLSIASLAAAALIAACGGGGGSSGSTSAVSGAMPGASSSGTVTAFGSVFVNGHEFKIGSAKIVDDDDPAASIPANSLEVGMSVEVKAAADSSDEHPDAAELHLHPLARGYVDASNTAAGTLTVMGQTVQVTSATNFSDHRACLTATTPCSAVSGQAGLSATSGSGSTAVPGSYVTVWGYLFGSGSSSANIVATLVSVADAPTSPGPTAFKAEGPVASESGTTLTIGALNVDLSAATCYAMGATLPCSGAFIAGQVVSAIGSTAPALPAASFTAGAARARPHVLVEAAGTPVEIEGKVSAVTASPAAFVVQGISVDASALPASSLPVVGDVAEVTGTVAADGKSVSATAIKVIHHAHALAYAFEGDAGGVSVGTASNTFVLTLLGQSIAVDANTRLVDRTVPYDQESTSSNPFNITTFQTYLAASKSQHLLVRAQADSSGALTATLVAIVPASPFSSVGGRVDATPAPVNAAAGGTTPSTFSVHGLAVSADPAAVLAAQRGPDGDGFTLGTTPAQVAAGDRVLARGTFASGSLGIVLPSGTTPSLMSGDIVIDFGPPPTSDDDDFGSF